MWPQILSAIWFILPAYVANSAAVDVAGIPFLKKYTQPVDCGRTWRGKRLLGDGKTWRGLIGGVSVGTFTGYLQYIAGASLPGYLPSMTVKLAFLLAFGALVGDMLASFLKRQSGLKRGAAVPLLDQLDYIIAAFAFATIVEPLNPERFLIVAALTIPLHLFANWVAYKIKLKDVWW
ncbi:MAG: CDP-2,3-bis-(O-geranylgeranyl)-sn-glycerol synthase [Candidatus Altiarchaeota archaeon]